MKLSPVWLGEDGGWRWGLEVVGWWGPVVLELGCWRDAAYCQPAPATGQSPHTRHQGDSANTAHCTVGNSEGTGTIVHSGKMGLVCCHIRLCGPRELMLLSTEDTCVLVIGNAVFAVIQCCSSSVPREK